jgi:hypothetical protein
MSGNTKHGSECSCTRCQGFQSGNQLPVKHGAYAMVQLAPRAAEIAAELSEVVPAASPADTPTIRLLALTLARIERIETWLAEQPLHDFRNEQGEMQPALKQLAGWVNTAARLCDRLALTPTSRGKLGLDLSRARGEALRQHLDDNYGEQDRET